MKVEWTEEQREVLDARNPALLVSAAAGSGKTAVLSSRIVSLLLDREKPLQIDRILVVTFTNAAAAEMRERIAAEIAKACEREPENAHLRKQLALVHHAKITTIDSFCLYILRNYAAKLGLSGAVNVGDPGEMKLLSADAMDRLMELVYEEKDEAVLSFIRAFRSTRSDEGVRDLILRTAEFSESFPWPDQWLKEAGDCYAGEEALKNSPLMKEFLSALSKELQSLGEELLRMTEEAQAPGGPLAYSDVLRSEGEALLALNGDFETLYAQVNAVSFKRLPAIRGDAVDPELKAGIQEARNKIKDKFNKIKKRFFHQPAGESIALSLRAGEEVRTLLSLAQRYRALFAEKKSEHNAVDFSDIEHYALRILKDPETGENTDVAELFADMYDEIMVDEYQDSNLVQEEILKALFRKEKNRLFMVGDVKQSIYRFRQARPELFMEKYHRFQKSGTERRIDLHKNFRSRPQILKAVNDVFYSLMGEDIGGIAYDEEAALFPGASYPDTEYKNYVSINLLNDTPEAREMLAADSAMALEERVMADTIRECIEKVRVRDAKTGELRACRYSDIAILLRSPGSLGPELIEELKKEGIPAVFSQTTGFFDAPEIAVLLNTLRIIDNPCQDIPLASVLKSPIGGFSEKELAGIVCEEREKETEKELSFFDCVMKSPRTADFRERLNRYRELSAWLPVHELIERICKETDYLYYEAALPAGEQREANLRMLMEKAVSFEEGRNSGLYRFIRYVESLRKYEADFGEAELVHEDMDAVRILSIHKSKGLEFPVVLLSGVGRKLNRRDLSDRLLLSFDHGIGLSYIDGKRRTKASNLPREAISCLLEREEMGEELRVLYVALTRAREYLFVTGVKKELNKQMDALSLYAQREGGLLPFEKRLSAGCYLDWLLPAALCREDTFRIRVLEPEELKMRQEREAEENRRTLKELLDRINKEEADQALLQRLSFCYPYEGEENVRDKISVTELKNRALLFAEGEGAALPKEDKRHKDSPVPRFARASEQRRNPAERGSAFHRFMECVSFSLRRELGELNSEEKLSRVKGEIGALKAQGKLSEEWAALVEPGPILRFLESPLAAELSAAEEAGQLYREKPFVMGLTAGEIYGTDSRETVIIQGIIDAFYRKDDQITILDYKTDRAKTEEELKSKYKIQMKLYREAVSRITGCRDIRTVLYSFALHREIFVEEGGI